MDVIRVQAPSAADARGLIASMDGKFSVSLDGDGLRSHVVEMSVEAEGAGELVELFDALGNWLAEAKLTACQIGFGDRTYTLAAAPDGQVNDPTAFLLERTIQLQNALDSRIVLEQAKGILVERHGITTEEAFRRLRLQARSSRTNIHVVAAGIVTSAQQPRKRSR